MISLREWRWRWPIVAIPMVQMKAGRSFWYKANELTVKVYFAIRVKLFDILLSICQFEKHVWYLSNKQSDAFEMFWNEVETKNQTAQQCRTI